jgi:hypothetical protein
MIVTAVTALEAWRLMPEQCRTMEMYASLTTFAYPMVLDVPDSTEPVKVATA